MGKILHARGPIREKRGETNIDEAFDFNHEEGYFMSDLTNVMKSRCK